MIDLLDLHDYDRHERQLCRESANDLLEVILNLDADSLRDVFLMMELRALYYCTKWGYLRPGPRTD